MTLARNRSVRGGDCRCGLTARSGNRLYTKRMKEYSNGNEAIFEAARKMAAKEEDLMVRRETKSGPASLQNKSIRLSTAFIPPKSCP
jgi:hypothetical protein